MRKPYQIGMAVSFAIAVLYCGAQADAGIVKAAFGALQKIWVVSDTDYQQITGATTGFNAFAALPGAAVDITIPAGKPQLVVARFSAESRCSNATLGTDCQ